MRNNFYFPLTILLSIVALLFQNPLASQIGEYQPLLAVNQYGYLPTSQKIAVIANPTIGYNQDIAYFPPTLLHLREFGTNQLMGEIEVVAWNGGAVHDQSGDQIWWADFSYFSLPGTYFFYDTQNDVHSAAFEIGECVYGSALRHAIRAFYYQRCGTPKTMGFADTGWTDATCHNHPLQDLDCRLYDNTNASTSRDMSGGWHDAGDYNKYVNFAFEPILDLCDAYSHYQVFADDLGLPESGNGIPDLLDEVAYELSWLMKMQNEDGSVHCMVGATSYDSSSPPSQDLLTRVYGPVTTAAAYSAAAMFARAALVMPESFSSTYLSKATQAWNWAVAHPDQTFYNSGIIVAGEQEPSAYEVWSRRMVAAVYLFENTGDANYLSVIQNEYDQAHMMEWSFVYPFESALQNALVHFSSIAEQGNSIAETLNSVYVQSVSDWNQDLLPAVQTNIDAYRAYLSDQNYTWGSNTTKGRLSHIFQNMLFYNLDATNSEEYQNAVQGVVDYFCGVNPNQTCFQTNMSAYGAERSCNSIYHAWFSDGSSAWDEVGVSSYGPAPGFVPGGVNPTYALDACCGGDCGSAAANAQCDEALVTPPLNQPVQKSWRDWNASWPQNSWTITEIGIYTQASFIKMMASLTNSACLTSVDIDNNTAERSSSIQLYPNPNNHSVVHLRSSGIVGQGIYHVEVMNAQGQLVHSESGRFQDGQIKHAIVVIDLPPGIYHVRVTHSSGQSSVPLIKQ